MRTNYVLIDFESVQPESLAQLAQEHFKVIVFVGASQLKIPFEFAVSLQHLGSRGEYVKISGNGSNALDFHVAYYLGRLVVQDPSAYFHIISKDTGFDPLIQHLRSKKILAGRVPTIDNIPAIQGAVVTQLPERIATILNRLGDLKSKPRTVKTLGSMIAAWLQNQATEKEVASLIQSLASRKYIELHETKVTYKLPPTES